MCGNKIWPVFIKELEKGRKDTVDDLEALKIQIGAREGQTQLADNIIYEENKVGKIKFDK